MTTCRVPGCVKARRIRGLCTAHYARWWRTGSTHSDKPLRSRNRVKPERAATPILIAHPVAAKRAAKGLPPASRHERLAALHRLAESHPSPERYEIEKARILGGKQ